MSLLKDDILKWAVKIKRNIYSCRFPNAYLLHDKHINISTIKETFSQTAFLSVVLSVLLRLDRFRFVRDPENALNHNSPLKKNQRANVSYLYSYSSAPATSCHRFETFNANMKALKCKMNTSDATRFRKRKFLWFVNLGIVKKTSDVEIYIMLCE